MLKTERSAELREEPDQLPSRKVSNPNNNKSDVIIPHHSIHSTITDSLYVLIFLDHDQHCFGKLAPEDWMIPTMTPNRPRADPKISMTRILTNVSGV